MLVLVRRVRKAPKYNRSPRHQHFIRRPTRSRINVNSLLRIIRSRRHRAINRRPRGPFIKGLINVAKHASNLASAKPRSYYSIYTIRNSRMRLLARSLLRIYNRNSYRSNLTHPTHSNRHRRTHSLIRHTNSLIRLTNPTSRVDNMTKRIHHNTRAT